MAHRRGRVNSESMHQILEQIRSVALSAADKHGLRNGDRTVKFPPALADPPLYSATEYHRPNVRSEWRSMLYRGTVIYIVKLAIIIINLHSVEKHKFPPISTTSKDDSPFCTRNAGSK